LSSGRLSFSLSQAWFRRIKNDKELNKRYAGKTVGYQWLQSFFGLSYLPSNEVNDVFISLMANAPPNVEHFTDYIVPLAYMKMAAWYTTVSPLLL